MDTQQYIGRFKIIRELGKGGQGAVYLALDPQLDRQVAIKTLFQHEGDTSGLSNEAKMVSKLQHPNIVSLFDAGQFNNRPYLVYAFVDGHTIEDLIKQKGCLSFVQAAEWACAILDGLAYAHNQGIVHLDIKPANIIVSATQTPMIMDFGLARWLSDQGQVVDFTLSGTPRYVAPELIAGEIGTASADLYAVGALLYEMVTGKSAVQGSGLYEVLYKAAHDPVAAPSLSNDHIDEQLEAIILKSVAKTPNERYGSALLMKQALQEYLGKLQQTTHVDNTSDNATLDFLLRRMRSKKDFPTISASISEINKIVSSDTTSSSRLTSAILQDFSLTSKLLKMVNAAVYGQFGGSVNTVSKAVTILGFETIRNIASSLIFIDFLQNKAQAKLLKDEITHTILASVVAAQLAVGHEVQDVEELMLCAMFFNLGKLLTLYYFFEESQEIAKLMDQGEAEDKAARRVLGLSYHDLGIGVARSWCFSPKLLTGMTRLQHINKATHDADITPYVVNLANELCEAARFGDIEHKSKTLAQLSKRFAPALSSSDKQLGHALNTGLNEFTRRATVLGVKLGETSVLEKVRAWSGQPTSEEATDNKDPELNQINRLESTLKSREEELEAYLRTASSELTLGAGIQDVTNTLIGEFVLNDVLQMILETIYRGMSFHRAAILIRDNKNNVMSARYGLGHKVDAMLPNFRFPLSYTADVFHLALTKGVDIVIADTHASNIADRIPAWYRQYINAPSFLLLPVMVKDKTMCMFYADMQQINSLNTSQQQLTLLRTLRNQAVLAIKQKV